MTGKIKMKSKILILLSASALVVYFNVDKLSAKLAISLALVFFVSILSLAISETKEREASSVEKYEKIKRRLLKAKVGIEEASEKVANFAYFLDDGRLDARLKKMGIDKIDPDEVFSLFEDLGYKVVRPKKYFTHTNKRNKNGKL